VAALKYIASAVSEGAVTFLVEEYKILVVFIIVFSAIIACLVEEELGEFWTVAAFVVGSVTSIAAGFIGMKVAVYSNSRTAYAAVNQENGLVNAFITAFRGGAVLGFCLSSLGLLNLLILIMVYEHMYLNDERDYLMMFECIAGYGLGGSSIALFARVGGGIYTKAADVGADLAGKVEEGLDEDDPKNPATIADNVGDNVGDIAGMGADLFGSFAESTCAALVVASTSSELSEETSAILYPLMISATGILCCLVTSFYATNVMRVDREDKIEKTLKYQLIISTLVLTPTLYLLSIFALPETFSFNRSGDVTVESW
jgi:inorganic pyrophosphatase